MPIQSPQIQVDSRMSERRTLGRIGPDTHSVDDNKICGHETHIDHEDEDNS
jgi:hypothetical protein